MLPLETLLDKQSFSALSTAEIGQTNEGFFAFVYDRWVPVTIECGRVYDGDGRLLTGSIRVL